MLVIFEILAIFKIDNLKSLNVLNNLRYYKTYYGKVTSKNKKNNSV